MIDNAKLDALEALVAGADGPWTLVPCTETTTGTIILHDRHGVSIADLQTEGEPCPCDRLIALAPTAIADLISEVRRLRGRITALNAGPLRHCACVFPLGGGDPEAECTMHAQVRRERDTLRASATVAGGHADE